MSILNDSLASAREAKLHYTSDQQPGIHRRRQGRGYSYFDARGERIGEPKERERIEALVIPPAWTDVWISPDPKGHLLATGHDERGRKQYLYHPRWREVRDATKYHHTVAFAEALPAIRRQVKSDMRRRGLPKEKVTAALVRLLEVTLIRVGNGEYARANGHYGLTTLRDRHVAISGPDIHFEFVGKSGKEQSLDLKNRTLARIVKACRDLPGYELFQYQDEEGCQRIDSSDVNAYLQSVTGEAFSAKDFRTWAGTLLAALVLCECDLCSSAQAKKNVVQAVKKVAKQLNNTPAVCRRGYIHPAVIEGYLAGSLQAGLERHMERPAPEGLTLEEAAVLAFLKEVQ
jgi:DNA topoisomerase-1